MRNLIQKKQQSLLLAAPILCIAMLVLFPVLANWLGKTIGYLLGFCIYWIIFCLGLSVYTTVGLGGVRGIYALKSDSTKVNRAYYLLAFVPCLATYLVVFRVVAPAAGLQVFLVAAVFAVINGFCEELFWRGTFNFAYQDVFHAYIYPTVFFGLWHIAVFFAKGIEYQGGVAALVGGAFFMGALWGWIAYKTKSIKIVTAAHIITNFFAFTGLIFENWYA